MNHLSIAKEALIAQAQAIGQLADRLDGEFQRAVELILGCKGRAAVCGMGKSGLIGKKWSPHSSLPARRVSSCIRQRPFMATWVCSSLSMF
ncbi:hypothetical protein PSCICM_03890 [Pseudomonas cichorii]|uniref:Arabinose-5-phosphate isomerase n=1 Tax=Pseudomonas cichorii TaxID=36746 RepID=A0ABQ1DLB2_PSECI|nr:kpsF/GutQ family protein [Pseudomonas cichorii JBC1]GFM74570.1 hypothetical protein PSCICM_03890 [Pseudomonas cichorii]GFM91783.1 hypothetical protein PSCICP_17550 [Pseudomonas cichorii]SDO10358.1 hypothetical protein SAMN05216599_105319 [Pseudomonas cichorii]